MIDKTRTSNNQALNQSLRIAIVGKGGAGKSMIAGTLARTLARCGHQVLALDVDTMPGLAQSIGLTQTEMSNEGIPESYGERQEERGWVLRDGVDVADLVDLYARPAPDGIHFLHLGKLPHRVKPGSTAAFRAVLNQYRADGWSMVGDLAAGTRQPFFGWSNFAQMILIIIEPSAKSVLSAHRLAGLVNRPLPEGEIPQKFAIIANKIRDDSDVSELRQLLAETAVRSVPIISTIPFDLEAEAAEQAGLAAIDNAPHSVAVQAIRRLASTLEKEITTSSYLSVQSG